MLPSKPPRQKSLSINSYESASSSSEQEPEYQDPDSPVPSNPPETTHMENPTITSSSETGPPSQEPEYEDPDSSMPPALPERTYLENPTFYDSVPPSEYEEPDSSTPPISPETKYQENLSFYEPVGPSEEAESQEPDSSTPPKSPETKNMESPTITSLYDTLPLSREPKKEEADSSTPPNSPKSGESPTITCLYDTLQRSQQPRKQEPDSSTPAIKDESQSVEFKPKPRPRSKALPKTPLSTVSSVESVDGNTNMTNTETPQQEQQSTDCKTSDPVCPPSSPPSDQNVIYSTIEDMFETEQSTGDNSPPLTVPRPRPARPPPPNIYYERPPSGTGQKAQSVTEENQQSKVYSTSSAVSEADKLYGTYDSKRKSATAPGTDRPAVPPRPESLYPTLSCYSKKYGTTSSQFNSAKYSAPEKQTPPPPSFNPPPPPSYSKLEPGYNAVEHRPYLELLPEKEFGMSSSQNCNQTIERTNPRPGSHNHSRRPIHQPSFEELEEINGMLRWLRRVERTGNMAPSLYGLNIEEEVREFNQRAVYVKKGMRLFTILMMRRNENLRDQIYELTDISDGLDKMQKKNKTIGIAGGTTGAVGGVTAVMGIALAPVTLGTSLIATVIGAGMVASAGGIGVHSVRANKKIVNRKAVERLVGDYKTNIVDLEHSLSFVLAGMNELRRHDFARLQRGGAQLDALKIAHLSQSVFKDDMNIAWFKSFTPTGGMSSEKLLQDFAVEINEYFSTKSGEKLRKSKESSFSSRVRLLAQNLNDQLNHLNHMWELFCQM